jgi:hypothetical protein
MAFMSKKFFAKFLGHKSDQNSAVKSKFEGKNIFVLFFLIYEIFHRRILLVRSFFTIVELCFRKKNESADIFHQGLGGRFERQMLDIIFSLFLLFFNR